MSEVRRCLLCAEEYSVVRPWQKVCAPCRPEYRRQQARISARKMDRTKRLRRYHAYQIRAFGLTPEDYVRMLDEQHGVCAICGGPQVGGKNRRLCVDHCHKTGEVRGLLCTKCNAGLGMYDDNVDTLAKALAYLRKHK